MKKKIILGVLFILFIISVFQPRPQINYENKELPVQINKDQETQDTNNGLYWDHMPISYYITNEEECGSYETSQIKDAFNKIQSDTSNIISFKKIKEPADINVTCSFIKDCYIEHREAEYLGDVIIVNKYTSVCNHTAGLAQITNLEGNKIINAQINLIGLYGFAETTPKKGAVSGFAKTSCGHINTELHEILHVFDYDHVNDINSIMSPSGDQYLDNNCLNTRKEIDIWILQDLIKRYK
ncbi:MAG: hypothetical protein Q8R00_02535 [Candidatus Nanoarchaeia archaeon]|nr:hypothetical protein [Candidatus Nanoarchaeia archaeon]